MSVLRGDVLSADGAVAVLAGGVEQAGETEGVAAWQSGWSPEHRHAHRTHHLLDLLHLSIILPSPIACPLVYFSLPLLIYYSL